MNNLQIEVKRHKLNQQFLEQYIEFKKVCFDKRIEDIDEIIKLFEVWLSSDNSI